MQVRQLSRTGDESWVSVAMTRGYQRARVMGMGYGARELWSAIVSQLGQEAQAGRGCTVGTVLQEYDRSAYLELTLPEGADILGPPLVMLCGEALDGPLSTRVTPVSSAPFRKLPVSGGDSCRLRSSGRETGAPDDFVLAVGDTLDVAVDASYFGSMQETIPEYRDIRSIDYQGEVWTRSAEVLRSLNDCGTEDGLGWLSDLHALVGNGSCKGSIGQLVESWVIALESGETFPDDAGLAVLGRGPGATPSGDDIISGILTILYRTTTGQMRETVRRLGETAVEAAADRTTTISTALLAQAAQGRTPTHIEATARALLAPMSRRQCKQTVSELLEVGHTSGADTLVGMLIAVLSLCPATD